MIAQFRQIPFFHGISEESVQRLQHGAYKKSYAAGELILMEGDEGCPVYFVLQGSVRAFRTNPEGREQTLTYLKAGEVFNLPAAFSSRHAAPASAVAAEDCELLEIKAGTFAEQTLQCPDLARKTLQELADRLSYFSELVHDVSLRNVRGRLARFILAQAQQPQTRGWTQEEIAMQLGTSREVVSRSLRELVRQGAIRMARQKILIQNEEILKSEAGL